MLQMQLVYRAPVDLKITVTFRGGATQKPRLARERGNTAIKPRGREGGRVDTTITPREREGHHNNYAHNK